MRNRTLVARLWGALVACTVALGTAGTLAGCRVTEDNIARWSRTEHGPEKLIAVLRHDKYEWPLRVAAAAELVRMKPRGGRRLGISRLIDNVAELTPDERKHVLDGLAPTLISEMKAQPLAAQGSAAAYDPSIPFKDAAFGLLAFDKANLVADPGTRAKLIESLIDWCSHDFERKLDNSSQMYGLEQMFRFIGAPAAKGLPVLITGDATKLDRIASLLAELGDAGTKEAAAGKLVELAKSVSSQAWIDKKKAGVEESNRASGAKASPEQLGKQLVAYQNEEMTRVFAAMKKVGQRPVIEFLLTYAGEKTNPEPRRQAAVAALEGRLDRNNASDVARVLALAAADDTPDAVRDLSLARVGEMPREQVVARLYEMFDAKKWKVRWVAAGTVLRMSTTAQLAEFMAKLPTGTPKDFSMTEALSYGKYIDGLAVKDG